MPVSGPCQADISAARDGIPMNRTAIAVDRERCIGAGMCAWTAPGIFDQDDEDGRVLLLRPEVEPEHEAAVREAVAACPSGAIRLLPTV